MDMTIKPCPFCGGEVETHHVLDNYRGQNIWTAGCSNNRCTCKPATGWCKTEAEAVAAWNTRAERTCRMPETSIDHGHIESNGVTEWRKCSECGEEILAWPAHYCPNCGAKVVE